MSYGRSLQITAHSRFHNSLPLVCIPGQINTSRAFSIKLRSISILPPMLGPTSLSGFIHHDKQQHFSRIPQFPHTYYMSRSSYPHWFNHANYILEAVPIMKLNMKIFLQRNLATSLCLQTSANYPFHIYPAFNLYRWTRVRNVVL